MSDPAAFVQALLAGVANSLQDVMTTVSLEDAQVLFRRGDAGDAFYIIQSGHIRIFTQDEDGKELTLNTLGPGEAFGEMALVDDQPRSAGAAAVGPVTLYRLLRKEFLGIVHSSPMLAQAVIRLLSERMRHMIDYTKLLAHWARLVAEGQYDQAMESIQDAGDTSDRALAAVAEAVRTMVQAVKEREQQLRAEVDQLRIQIDEAKRKRQVEEITETQYFRELTQRARRLRKRPEG